MTGSAKLFKNRDTPPKIKAAKSIRQPTNIWLRRFLKYCSFRPATIRLIPMGISMTANASAKKKAIRTVV
jgi:hypothetical protein